MAIPASLRPLGRAFLTSAVLLVALFHYSMANLSVESIEMAHMDPTDIVLVPFDLPRLTVHVTATAILGWFLASNSIASAIQWLQATMAFWMIAIVCGTPPTREIYHTGLACAYVATLTVFLPPQGATPTIPWWQTHLTFPPHPTKSSSQQQQFLAMAQIHSTLFLTIPFAVLRLYDWGSQIQRWPLPIVLGSTYGFLLGTILGTIGILALNSSPTLQRWYDGWIIRGGDGGMAVSSKDN